LHQLLQEEKAAIPRVLRMLREVCHKLGFLNTYFAEAQTFTSELKESCVESGIAVLEFFSYIYKFLRHDMPMMYSTAGE
jgi:hypothetical protein